VESYRFDIDGMTCENCVESVTETLAQDPQIKDLKVSLNPPLVRFASETNFNAEKINKHLKPLKKYSVHDAENLTAKPFLLKYLPLILIFLFTAGVPALVLLFGKISADMWMLQFMGVTLITLSYFKFLDLPKFAQAFSTYDPFAKKISAYGYVYPFFELFAGIGFILSFQIKAVSIFTILFLLFTTLGVIKSLLKKEKFQCACLGTAFNLPLTKVTIIENALMIFMSLLLYRVA
jgi:copper chaperone CopZ